MPISTTIEKPSTADYKDDFQVFKSQFSELNTDDKLAMLWSIYDSLSENVLENPDANKEADSSSELYNKLSEKPAEEQLQFMRDVLSENNNPLIGEYSKLSNTTNIALWYRLGQGMADGTVVPVPSDYTLSTPAQELANKINSIDFEQRYIFMRNAILG